MWKLRSDPWRKVVWARGTPKETWDSPELSWVRGSDAIKCLLRCWAPGSGSGQYQVTTKLPLRHWHSMPTLRLPTIPGERRLKSQKQSRDSEHWVPMTTHRGYSGRFWDTVSGFQNPQFSHFEPHWKLHLRSQFWLYVKPHLKWRKYAEGWNSDYLDKIPYILSLTHQTEVKLNPIQF